ncbi:rhomboid-domain-containing protein [Leucogyrophana mollusca]|uniref:Rhomboid-domain-containing protein n=1 Tax=Leucogyrophana mollusca TaxID=85980 RepID=A0ACB8BA68_9AGAM|nr:rhomboid-domain-containing protein [Leucogyrophana mollusca]
MLSTTSYRHSFRPLKTCLGALEGRSWAHSLLRNSPRKARAAQKKVSADIPSFRDQIARSSKVESFSERMKRPTIRHQVLFFIAGSWLAFSLAATQTQVETDYWSKRLVEVSNLFNRRPPSNNEMRRVQYLELGRILQAKVENLKGKLAEWPIALKSLVLSAYVGIAQPYLDATEGRRMCWMICGANAAVYLAWKIPRLGPVMNRSFTHHPLSGLSYTLLTSMFSHKSFIHFLANSMALASFGSAATHYLVNEQSKDPEHPPESTGRWHFLAFFLSAGLFSGLVSHTVATKVMYPRIVSQLASTATASASSAAAAVGASAKAAASPATRQILPSLGASGAIYAAVTVSALAFPDAEITLVFPPFFPIPIQTGVGALVMLDIVGVLRGWRMFDHYAHLGGAAFGAMYYMYGPSWWNYMRGPPQPPSRKRSFVE